MSNDVNIIVNHYHHFPDGGGFSKAVAQLLSESERRIVSQLSDEITKLTTSVDAAIARAQADNQTMLQKIADLQALVDSGTATPADIAALAALEVKIDALDPTSPVVVPPGPPAPAPAPAP